MMNFIEYNGVKPNVCETAKVFEGAKIIGDVTLSENSNVWFNAVLRGDTSKIFVGANTNIQDNAVLHGDHTIDVVLGDNITVGHGAIIHGATVKSGSLIGMGAILLNGVTIGHNCLVAAGAVCAPNSTFADNTLIVGNPAKEVKVMSEKMIKAMHDNTSYYVSLSKEY